VAFGGAGGAREVVVVCLWGGGFQGGVMGLVTWLVGALEGMVKEGRPGQLRRLQDVSGEEQVQYMQSNLALKSN
jgi:hypothetical protein